MADSATAHLQRPLRHEQSRLVLVQSSQNAQPLLVCRRRLSMGVAPHYLKHNPSLLVCTDYCLADPNGENVGMRLITVSTWLRSEPVKEEDPLAGRSGFCSTRPADRSALQNPERQRVGPPAHRHRT